MPTYEYKRADGTTFEIVQRITADPLTICPTTGQVVKRIISGGAGLVFKGTGFYQTDYVRKHDDGKAPKSTSTSSTSDSSSDSSKDSSKKKADPAPSKKES